MSNAVRTNDIPFAWPVLPNVHRAVAVDDSASRRHVNIMGVAVMRLTIDEEEWILEQCFSPGGALNMEYAAVMVATQQFVLVPTHGNISELQRAAHDFRCTLRFLMNQRAAKAAGPESPTPVP